MRRFRHSHFLLLMAVLAFAVGGGTHAVSGSPDAPVLEPIAQTYPADGGVPQSDWGGLYLGLSVGSSDGAVNRTEPADTALIYGVHLGYDFDFGRFVLGGEVEASDMAVDLGGAAWISSVARLKLRGGYDMGQTLVYLTAGAAQAQTLAGHEGGEFAGFGVSFMFSDRIRLGGEVLEHRFGTAASADTEIDATTLTLRAQFEF